MQHLSRSFFADDILSDDSVPEDDLDKLFNKLEPVKPPPLLIKRILTSVSRLNQPDQPAPWDALEDNLIVRREKQQPS